VDVQRDWPDAARARVRWLQLNRFVPAAAVVLRTYRSLQEGWAARATDRVDQHGRIS
jgi:hypothetical protein